MRRIAHGAQTLWNGCERIDELKATQKALSSLIVLDRVPSWSVYKMYKNNMAEAALKDINCPVYGSHPM